MMTLQIQSLSRGQAGSEEHCCSGAQHHFTGVRQKSLNDWSFGEMMKMGGVWKGRTGGTM